MALVAAKLDSSTMNHRDRTRVYCGSYQTSNIFASSSGELQVPNSIVRSMWRTVVLFLLIERDREAAARQCETVIPSAGDSGSCTWSWSNSEILQAASSSSSINGRMFSSFKMSVGSISRCSAHLTQPLTSQVTSQKWNC